MNDDAGTEAATECDVDRRPAMPAVTAPTTAITPRMRTQDNRRTGSGAATSDTRIAAACACSSGVMWAPTLLELPGATSGRLVVDVLGVVRSVSSHVRLVSSPREYQIPVLGPWSRIMKLARVQRGPRRQ